MRTATTTSTKARRARATLLALAITLALLLSLASLAPVYAQSPADLEAADDANSTATTPEECVRPKAPGDSNSDIGAAQTYPERLQKYEDCVTRTQEEDASGEAPAGSETSKVDPSEVNKNATEPEECVKPEVPTNDEDLGAASDYNEARKAYQDCLARTGSDEAFSGEEGAAAPSGESTTGKARCEAPASDAPFSEKQEYEDCLKDNGQLQNGDTKPGETKDGGSKAGGGKGGLVGVIMPAFKGILQWVWDNTFGWALKSMAGAFETNALSLPDLEGRGDLLSFYTDIVERLRPAILVGILLLGTLMMVRHDNYDLAYAGFQGLPKLLGVAMAMAFLPQFMGQLAQITAGLTEAFFPSGQDVNAAGEELFKAAVGNMAVTNFLNVILLAAAAWVGMMVVIVALLNKVLYATLFIAGPFALVASLVPTLSPLGGSWFRGVLACAAIPALWSIELGIGTLAVKSPEAFFGEGANSLGFISESAVTSIGAIIILWLMYKTPFKVMEWAFNVQLPGRGGLMGLARTAANLAVAVPVKTAIATTVKNAVGRGAGGAAVSRAGGGGGGKSETPMPGKEKGAGGGAARKVQQAQSQAQRARRVAGDNARASFKYQRTMGARNEAGEQFMQGGARGTGGRGMKGDRSGDRSGHKG